MNGNMEKIFKNMSKLSNKLYRERSVHVKLFYIETPLRSAIKFMITIESPCSDNMHICKYIEALYKLSFNISDNPYDNSYRISIHKLS